MPLREGGYTRMETLPTEERLKEPVNCQAHWYYFLGPWVRGRTVLEVGAGSGDGVDILRWRGATTVHGLDPLPLRSDIIDTPFETVTPKSYDIVTACDVIEHVERDVVFFHHMLTVAREFVFFSTPNWNYSHAENRYHVREYSPAELQALVGNRRHHIFSSNEKNEIRAVRDFDQVEHNFGVLLESIKWT